MKINNKKYYDDKTNPLKIELGDTVYLRSEPYSKLKTLSKRYKIVGIEHPNVLISDAQGTMKVHKNRLTK